MDEFTRSDIHAYMGKAVNLMSKGPVDNHWAVADERNMAQHLFDTFCPGRGDLFHHKAEFVTPYLEAARLALAYLRL